MLRGAMYIMGCIAADQERYTFADIRYGIDHRISTLIL